MADFSVAYQKTLSNEGGYLSAADAAKFGDSGGETYMGISRNNNPDWAGWAKIDAYKATYGIPAWNSYIPDPDGSLGELVKEKYKQNYWDLIKGDSIQNQDVANLLYDLTVNSGGEGVKILQQGINNIIIPSSIAVDGVVGNDTLSKINSLPQDQIYQQLYDGRKNWINTVGVKTNPNAVSNWLSRLDKYRKSIVEDISAQYTIETLKFGKSYVNIGIGIIILSITFIGGGLLVYHLKRKKDV